MSNAPLSGPSDWVTKKYRSNRTRHPTGRPCPLPPAKSHAKHEEGWCCGNKLKPTNTAYLRMERARVHEPDDRCSQKAGYGTDHQGAGGCRYHGGNSISTRMVSHVDLEERRARTLLQRLERPGPSSHPVIELLKVAAVAREWLSYCITRVAELKDLEHKDDAGHMQERALVLIFERSLDRAAKVYADLARLDLDERRFRLASAEARMVDDAAEAVLREMGLSARIEEFRDRFGDHLSRGLADGSGAPYDAPSHNGKRPLAATGETTPSS